MIGAWVIAFAVVAASEPSGFAVTRDLAYGDDPVLQSLDVYAPSSPGRKRPVIVFVHGGGWSEGSKGDHPQKAALFVDAGFVLVSINHRLSPAVRHPAHAEDVARAVAWVHRNIARHGGDPSSIHLIGHSAGAQLVALVALAPRYLQAHRVPARAIRGVVLLDGSAYDLVERVPAAGGWMREMLVRAFGDDPATWREASPIHHVDRARRPPPFLLLHVAGREASKEQADSLAQALIAAGGRAEVVSMKDRDHVTIEALVGAPDDPVGARIVEFVRSTTVTP